MPEKDINQADVVLVEHFAEGLNDILGCLARLHGKRLVDKEWLLSKMRSGNSVAFACGLHFHLRLYLDESFVQAHPAYAKTLVSASKAFSEKLKGTSAKPCLHVYYGQIPEKPKHPRLTFGVVSQQRLGELHQSADGKCTNVLNLDQCLQKLTDVQRG